MNELEDMNIELLDAVSNVLFAMTRYPPMRINRHRMREISEEARALSYEYRIEELRDRMGWMAKKFENRSPAEKKVFYEVLAEIEEALK